ncbi:MAG: transglutaminase family protein [Promethearchaeota archaeon]
MTNPHKNFEEFLKQTFFMDYEHPSIQEKAKELTEGIPEEDDISKAIQLFYFVRDQIKYSVKNARESYNKENWKSSITLKRGFGFCIPKAILLASLARAVGIPSRLHYVDIVNHMTSERLKKDMGSNLFIFHGFVELFLNGKWVEANCAFDKELCLRKNFPWVDFDGIKDGLFASTNKDGKPFVEYIKDRGVYNDAPHQKIMETWAIEYPNRYSPNGKPIK